MNNQKLLLVDKFIKENESRIKAVYKKISSYVSYEEFINLIIKKIDDMGINILDDSEFIKVIDKEIVLNILIQKIDDFIKNSKEIDITFFKDLVNIYLNVELDFESMVRVQSYILDNEKFNEIINKFFTENFIKNKNENIILSVFTNQDLFDLFENYCIKNNYYIYDYYVSNSEKTELSSIEADYLRSLDSKILSEDEEIEYAVKMQNGDRSARKYLIEHNLRLVVSIAKNYRNRGLDFMDLIQEGNIGLMKGLDHYNPNKGFRISTYVTNWIKQSIMNALYEKGSNSLKIPRNKKVLIQKIRKAENILTSLNGYKPSVEEIAEYLNISIQQVKESIQLKESVLSLDEEYGTGNDSYTLKDVIPSSYDLEEEVHKNMLSIEINKLFDMINISEQEKEILKLRNGFYDNRLYSYEEIGKRFNISRERVRQIEGSCLRRLKAAGIKTTQTFEKNKEKSYGRNEQNEYSKSIREVFIDYTVEEIMEALNELDNINSHIFMLYYNSSIESRIKLSTLKDIQYKSIITDFISHIANILNENKKWDIVYQMIINNINYHGYLNVSRDFKTIDGINYCENGVNLYQWLINQNIKYNNNELTERKKELLFSNANLIEYFKTIDFKKDEQRAILSLTLNKLFYKVAYKRYDCTVEEAITDARNNS